MEAWAYQSRTIQRSSIPSDVCAHKSFDFTYTIIPVYEGDELIPREFIIDMFASDGYAKHLVVSNGVLGKTIDYRTGAIN